MRGSNSRRQRTKETLDFTTEIGCSEVTQSRVEAKQTRNMKKMMLMSTFTAAMVLHAGHKGEDLFYNPFSADSAFHRPIGSGAIYAADDAPETLLWLQHDGMKFNYEHPYGSPFAAVDRDDPVVEVRFSPSQIRRDDGSLPVRIRIPRERFPVNPETVGFYPDGAVAIFDRESGLVHEFYNYRYNEGSPLATIHRSFPIDSPGHGADAGRRVGVTATGISVVAGALQPWKLETPGHQIGHALQLVLPRKPRHHQPMLISKDVQWPATTGDGSATDPKDNLGLIPYGALMAIPPVDRGGPDLEAMDLSEPGLRLAEALRDYGAYVIDGGQMPIIRTTGNFSSDLFEKIHFRNSRDLAKIYQAMRLVRNSVQGATATVYETARGTGFIGTHTWPAGGGEPLAPNTAIDAH